MTRAAGPTFAANAFVITMALSPRLVQEFIEMCKTKDETPEIINDKIVDELISVLNQASFNFERKKAEERPNFQPEIDNEDLIAVSLDSMSLRYWNLTIVMIYVASTPMNDCALFQISGHDDDLVVLLVICSSIGWQNTEKMLIFTVNFERIWCSSIV